MTPPNVTLLDAMARRWEADACLAVAGCTVARALRIVLFSTALVLVAGVAGGLYLFSLVTSDNLEFRDGGLTYAIIVNSRTVSEWPRGEPARFTYSARDGTAPAVILLSYRSQDSVSDLMQKIRDHCRAEGFAWVPEDRFLPNTVMACDAEDYRIEVALGKQGGGNGVQVSFLEQ